MNQVEFFSEFGHLALAPDGVARLRRLILDLAIRGRLVAQDPSDDPASSLIKQINEERQRQVDTGTLKSGRSQDGRPYEITHTVPDHWIVASFEQLSFSHDNRRVPIKKADRQSGEFPYYGASGAIDHVKDWIFEGEYLLIAEDGGDFFSQAKRIALIVDGKFWANNHVHVVSFVSQYLTRWVANVLNATELTGLTTGIAVPKLPWKSLARIPVPVPPLSEQERIVEKVDELMAVCDELEQEQAKAKTLRAQTTQSSLKRVVESGREETPEAIELLQQSFGLTLRPGDGAAEALAKTREAILDLAVRGRLSGNIGGSQIALGDLAEIRGGQQPKVKVDKYWGGEEPFLMGGDFSEDSFRVRAGSRTLTAEGVKASGSPLVPADSVVMMTVGTIGKVCLLDIPMHISPNLTGIALADDRLDPDFLYWQLRAIRDRLVQIGGGSAQPFISKTALSEVEMFVPSVEDQRSIVDRIDELMAVCDQLEESLATERQLAADFSESAVHTLVS